MKLEQQKALKETLYIFVQWSLWAFGSLKKLMLEHTDIPTGVLLTSCAAKQVDF